MENITPNPQVLVDAVQMRMPYGKYKDMLICDLPVSYLEWMHSKGFPAGKLGMALSTVFEIKTNGMTAILTKVKQVVAAKRNGG